MEKFNNTKFIANDFETIKNAMLKIKKNGTRTLVVVNTNKQLLGTLSEGDIQKALIKNVKVNESIKKIYNKKPKKINIYDYKKINLREIFISGQFGLIPVVNKNNVIKKIVTWNDVFRNEAFDDLKKIEVVIMAGGKGTRLLPLTKIIPKPLVPINNKPMLQHIMENFTYFNFKKFNLVINHQADLIKSYFKPLNKKFDIKFINEKKPLGTAGGLSLVKNLKSENFILSNCDTIFRIDYQKFYKTHIKNKNRITLVVSNKNYELPYGVCKIKSQKLNSISEKPKLNFLVNAGLYLLDKRILKLLKKNQSMDMNNLLNICIKKRIKIGTFLIENKNWVDLGQLSDFKKASENFE